MLRPAAFTSKGSCSRRHAFVAAKHRWHYVTKPEISGIALFFIVKSVPSALAFYRDRFGFDVTVQGPDPDDIFFGIVQRGAAMIS